MKVLMTGDNGYIGSQMKAYFTEAGHEVVGVDSNYFYWCTMGVIPPHADSHIYTDIRRITTESLEGVDAVVHLAALSNDPMGDIDENLTQEINRDASIRLAEMAKRAGVRRFIFSSSCSVYGDSGEYGYSTEESPVNPLTAYAKSKIEAELVIGLMADENFSPTFLRNSTVYGYSPRLRTDLIVNAMTASAYTDKIIKVYGNGSLWRPLVHVLDLCEVFLQVLEREPEVIHNQVINVGNTEDNLRVIDVANIVKKCIPEAEILLIPQDQDSRNYKVNCDKLFSLLPNYISIYDVESGVKELVDAIQDYEAIVAINLTSEYLFSSKYNRVKKLREMLANGRLDRNLYWA